MGKCVVKNCNSRSGKDNKASGITYHTVPKEEERRKKWIKNIKLLRKETDWLPTKSTVICSKHFRDSDKSGSCRVYLSNEAIPVVIAESYAAECAKLFVPENMNVESDEEIEEITETPLMNKMRKVIHRLKILSEQRLKKIKALRAKNQRLEINNKKLKNIIEELKKNAEVKRNKCSLI